MEQAGTYDEAVEAKRYRAKRLGLLSLSAICAVLAIFLLAFNLGFLSRSQELAGQYAQSDYAADVLLIMSYDESDPSTPLARDGVLDVMGRSAVNVDVMYMNAHNAPLGSSAHYTWVGQLRQRLDIGPAPGPQCNCQGTLPPSGPAVAAGSIGLRRIMPPAAAGCPGRRIYRPHSSLKSGWQWGRNTGFPPRRWADWWR